MARRKRDLTEAQNALVRDWMRRLLRPPFGTGTLSQTALAERLEISQSQISQVVERNQGTSFQVAMLLAEMLGEDLNKLVKLRSVQKPPKSDPVPESTQTARRQRAPGVARAGRR